MSTKPRVCAVIGGAGFLGRELTRQLDRNGWRVHVVDREDSCANSVPGAASTHAASTTDSERLKAVLAKAAPEVVFDLAYLVGKPAEESILAATQNNLLGPAHVMDAARAAGASRYVYASSIAVYGPGDRRWGRPVRETDQLALDAHTTAYGAFKCTNEFQARAFASQSGLRCTSVRLSIVLGPGRSRGLATWSSRVLDEVQAGRREVSVPVPAAARCNVLTCADAVELLRRVAEHPSPGPVYNSGGHDVSAAEFTDVVRRLRPSVAFDYAEGAPNIPFVSDICAELAAHDLGFSPKPLAESVQELLGR